MRVPFAMFALFVTVLLPTAIVADDKQLKAERLTYRVVGLFSPDREKDLRVVFDELSDFKLLAVNFDDAEIDLEFSPARLFPGQKPERVIELVDQKLRTATRGTFGVKARRTVSNDKLQKIVIPAAGLDCKACCLAAYEAIAGIEGVWQATASFKEGRITARIDPAKTNQDTLVEALKKKGVVIGKR